MFFPPITSVDQFPRILVPCGHVSSKVLCEFLQMSPLLQCIPVNIRSLGWRRFKIILSILHGDCLEAESALKPLSDLETPVILRWWVFRNPALGGITAYSVYFALITCNALNTYQSCSDVFLQASVSLRESAFSPMIIYDRKSDVEFNYLTRTRKRRLLAEEEPKELCSFLSLPVHNALCPSLAQDISVSHF